MYMYIDLYEQNTVSLECLPPWTLVSCMCRQLNRPCLHDTEAVDSVNGEISDTKCHMTPTISVNFISKKNLSKMWGLSRDTEGPVVA